MEEGKWRIAKEREFETDLCFEQRAMVPSRPPGEASHYISQVNIPSVPFPVNNPAKLRLLKMMLL